MCGPFLITHGSFPATHASGGRIHAISQPTTSLPRRVVDLSRVHGRFSTIAARSPMSRAGALASPGFESSIPGFYFSLLAFPAPHGGSPE